MSVATLPRLRPAPNDTVEIRTDHGKGRGIFARAPIAKDMLIEAAPVIILSAADCRSIDNTILHNYYFHWEGDDRSGTGILALGLVSLCNHSNRPRAVARRNIIRSTLDLIALQPIEAGEEVTIDYGCELWFDPLE